jgi:hypothetical protein
MDDWRQRTIADEDVVDLSRRIADDNFEDDNGMAEEVDRMSNSG